MIVLIIVAAILVIFGVLILIGKGDSLIAGYYVGDVVFCGPCVPAQHSRGYPCQYLGEKEMKR